MITTVILDIEGVLVKKDGQALLERSVGILKEAGVSIDPNAYFKLMRPEYLKYTLGEYGNDEDYYHALLAAVGVPYDLKLAQKLQDSIIQSFYVYPQIPGILEYLYKKYKLFALSNHVSTWIIPYLTEQDISKYFQRILISDAFGIRKPSSRIFMKALEAARVQPQKCAFFDNKSENVEAARSFGMIAKVVDEEHGLKMSDITELGL